MKKVMDQAVAVSLIATVLALASSLVAVAQAQVPACMSLDSTGLSSVFDSATPVLSRRLR